MGEVADVAGSERFIPHMGGNEKSKCGDACRWCEAYYDGGIHSRYLAIGR